MLLSSIVDPHKPGPSTRLEARELEERVEAALLELPQHHREAIILRHLCGFEYAEIAEAMGFAKEVNARMAVSRALRRLKSKLEGSEGR
jgi:RNA polymerase sigma-70 factor (ECF subfamily)